jgi:DNA-binding LacI/PurR family transcriptional regulator/signal transduction histidine kinase
MENQVNPLTEYRLPYPPAKKSKFTIGFLDETSHREFHNQKMAGVFEAARKYNVNIIRFTDNTSIAYKSPIHVKMIFDHIHQYHLDGLIFLGWVSSVCDFYEQFTRQFASIPTLSLGKIFDNIPSVNFHGEKYIHEMLLHLIQVHHVKRIAYIAPMREDDRNNIYINVMKEYGIYDPEFVIHLPYYEYPTLEERAKRSLDILLDAQKSKPEAIMSLYSQESVCLLHELKNRGIKVPQDIIITSYEDAEIAKYSSPALTTVYYPFYELVFHGCERMIQLLTQGSIPFYTELPGKTIYRKSCGCMSDAVKSAGNYQAGASAGSLETMTAARKQAIISEMFAIFPNSNLDFNRLLEAFLNDFIQQGDTFFLPELSTQLRRFPFGFNNPNIEQLVSVFRRYLLPHIAHQPETLLWSGDIFQQAQILVWEKVTSIDGQQKVNTKIFNQALHDIGHILMVDFSIRNLLDSLAKTLPKLRIPGCYIFLFNSIFHFDIDSPVHYFDDYVLVFEYNDNTLINAGEHRPVNMLQMISEILAAHQKFYAIITHMLFVGDEFMGFVLYEPGPMDETIYQVLSDHISSSLRGSILLEKLEFNYKKLAEQAHREGMADVSTGILHNMGNILNSINNSICFMKDLLSSSSFADLAMANTMLEKHIHELESFIRNNPKSDKLWQFYLKLGDSFCELKRQLLYHINRLEGKVSSINEIITAQQNYAGTAETMEELNVVSILEDALKMHAELINNYHVTVIRDYQTIPKVQVQRNKLFHIIIHLIGNALDAMLETPIQNRILKIMVDAGTEGKIIRISDSGFGIPPQMLKKIFEYHNSTKKDGKGLNLYSCADYMTEMGGKVWAESEGIGKGATFVLQFK